MNIMIPEEIAARWRVSEDTVYRAIHSGKLKAFRVGKALRVKQDEVERYEDVYGVTP